MPVPNGVDPSLREDPVTGKRNEALTTVTDLKYPMVDLVTSEMMPLMYLNILMAWYLLLLTAPWLFMEAWMKGPEIERAS
jgi:hypothetical protein